MKDLFSNQSNNYAHYRPAYPKELVNYLIGLESQKNTVWDCGAGSGQMTRLIAPIFKEVYATDISQNQLAKAPKIENVHYSNQPAEQTNFPDDFFDLIIVAQAIHWFDFHQFYQEVRRVLHLNGILVITGYALIRVNEPINAIIDQFYNSISRHWEPERKYIDQHYQTIPFPFEEMEPPSFQHQVMWTLEHFISYVNTWSAIKTMKSQIMEDPTTELRQQLLPHWNSKLTATFPTLLRVGYVN